MENESVATVAGPASGDSDHDLEAIVKGRLNGRVRAFRLTPESRGLVLSGWCHTYYAKQLAQHLVMESTKLRILVNDIDVVNGDEP